MTRLHSEARVDLDDGTSYLVGVEPPEDASPVVRDGLALRRVVILGGTCACGARQTRPNRAQRRAARGQVLVARVVHADECPAIAPELDAYVAGLRRAGAGGLS